MSENLSIKTIDKNNKSILVDWSDGFKSKYNFLWLRDNCPSEVHPTARERTFNLLDVSEDIHPKNYSLNSEGNLEIEWSEGGHKSVYERDWLRHNCYSLKHSREYVSPYRIWDKSMQDTFTDIQIDYSEIISSDDGLKKWLQQLHFFGISIVKNAPTDVNSGFDILKNISHTRETFFKTPFEVIDIPNPNNSAYTAAGLRNHIDLPYYEIAPGYQFLHCLINNATGGESVAVDGFKVIDYLKNNHPNDYDVILNTSVKFVNRDYTTNTIRVMHKPIITLDHNNDYNDIRFSVAYMGVMDCHPDQMDHFYSAYRKLLSLLHDQRFEINFRMQAGDIFSFNNRRVLHGRKEYDANSGERHLQGYYMDRDEILGRLNYIENLNP